MHSISPVCIKGGILGEIVCLVKRLISLILGYLYTGGQEHPWHGLVQSKGLRTKEYLRFHHLGKRYFKVLIKLLCVLRRQLYKVINTHQCLK